MLFSLSGKGLVVSKETSPQNSIRYGNTNSVAWFINQVGSGNAGQLAMDISYLNSGCLGVR